jgi:DNA-binding XRE family transcriptional regulator
MDKNSVKELREANAWSIAELARKASLAPQTVSKMEKGENTAKNSKLKIAKVFGKKYDLIFFD